MGEDEALLDKTIALLATDGFEDSELTVPLGALQEAGAEVVIISEEPGTIQGKDGTEIEVDQVVDDVHVGDFDGLLLPGGAANPDKMRMNHAAVSFVHDFFEEHKPVAAICHAPWMLIEAGVVEGRTVTSWPSLKTDLLNAGAEWVDEEVVVDNGLVTSRKPDDLRAFSTKIVEEFAEGVHAGQLA
jgi:protease I